MEITEAILFFLALHPPGVEAVERVTALLRPEQVVAPAAVAVKQVRLGLAAQVIPPQHRQAKEITVVVVQTPKRLEVAAAQGPLVELGHLARQYQAQVVRVLLAL